MYAVLHTLGSLTAFPACSISFRLAACYCNAMHQLVCHLNPNAVILIQVHSKQDLVRKPSDLAVTWLHSNILVFHLCDVSSFPCCTVFMINNSSVTLHLCAVFAQSGSLSGRGVQLFYCKQLFCCEVHPLQFTSRTITSFNTAHLTARLSYFAQPWHFSGMAALST